MANHVKTQIRVANPDVIHALLTEEGVDFNRVVPQPGNIERGDCTGTHAEGVVCWYEWNQAHWGTKWNAYETEVAENQLVVEFETAWAHPLPVIEQLSRLYPQESLRVQYADEDTGYNQGKYVVTNGRIKDQSVADGSAAAVAHARRLWA